jgi:gluconolactonase
MFLQTAAAAGIAGWSLRSSFADGISDRYAGLESGKYLSEGTIETTIEDDEVFTEGPAWGDGVLYFTNVPVSKILKWDPDSKKLSVFRENTNKTNGLFVTPDGDLLCCQGGKGRVTRIDLKSGNESVVADEYNGFPFAAPNDLVMDKQGRIYFTSRPGVEDPTKGNVNAVYRIDPDGKVTQLLHWPYIHMPNGIVISPDGKTLHLIEAHPDADHYRKILSFNLSDEGTLSNRQTLIDFYPGRSGDGMCIDREGNLYVAAGLHNTRETSETLDTKPGIHVLSPQGKLLAYRETPEDTVTNCTFGGEDRQTLYVTCGTKLVSFRSEIPGYVLPGK